MRIPWKSVFAILSALATSGCQKNAASVRSPAPPAALSAAPESMSKPLTPVAQFTVEPTTIIRGQSATLRWDVTGDVFKISINGIGVVQKAGNQRVYPSSSTTYTLNATSAAGDTTVMAVLMVSPPPPALPPAGGAASQTTL